MKDNATLSPYGLWFMKFFLMIAVDIGDMLTLATTPFLFIIFWPVNIMWCISAITMGIMFSESIMKDTGYPMKREFYCLVVKYLGYDNAIVDDIANYMDSLPGFSGSGLPSHANTPSFNPFGTNISIL